MKPVLSKMDFVRRYKKGEFGNAAPTWDGLQELCNENGYGRADQLFHIRNRVAGGETWYDIPKNDLPKCWYKLMEVGVDMKTLYISAMAPTEKTLFQGEVIRSINHIDLTYTFVAKPMRDALAEDTKHANGMKAVFLLKRFLCHNSLIHITGLMDWYSDHTIEFSTYSTNWGTIPGYNTVYWEIRKY